MFFDQQQPNNNKMNTPTPTPTPRTDAATYPADCLGKTLVTNRDCARALERELATERARTKQTAIALKDAISTYFGADKLVTAERIEAWQSALKGDAK